MKVAFISPVLLSVQSGLDAESGDCVDVGSLRSTDFWWGL